MICPTYSKQGDDNQRKLLFEQKKRILQSSSGLEMAAESKLTLRTTSRLFSSIFNGVYSRSTPIQIETKSITQKSKSVSLVIIYNKFKLANERALAESSTLSEHGQSLYFALRNV